MKRCVLRARRCSNGGVELSLWRAGNVDGEPGAARTLDPRLKRALLYQLSYGLSPEGNVNRTGVGCRDLPAVSSLP